MNEGWSGLAGAGFFLAVISLSWQLWYAVRIDRARLKVRTASMQVFSQVTPPLDVVAMTVTNAGRRATVLQSVHLTLGRHTMPDRLWPARFRPRRWRRTKALMPFASSELPELNQTAVLPRRLEPGDEVTTYVQTRHVREALHHVGTDPSSCLRKLVHSRLQCLLVYPNQLATTHRTRGEVTQPGQTPGSRQVTTLGSRHDRGRGLHAASGPHQSRRPGPAKSRSAVSRRGPAMATTRGRFPCSAR